MLSLIRSSLCTCFLTFVGRYQDLSTRKLPFVPYSTNESVVPLLGSLLGPIDTDDSVTPPMVTLRQIDDQFLITGFHTLFIV